MITNLYDALAVTPSDTQNLVAPAQGSVAQTNANPNFIGTGATATVLRQRNMAVALAVAVTGNVSIVDWLGNTQVLALVAGFTYHLRVTRVNATLTTATGITAFFPVFQ